MIPKQGFVNAAKDLGCEVEAIQAVSAVEGGGTGFLKSGKIILKFEGHIFHKFTKGRYDQDYPTLSYPSWTERYSQSGAMAYDRFNRAFHLDPHAAMLSTSFGEFQIMGFNYSSCGFKTVDAFLDYLKVSETNQLEVFCSYIKAMDLAKYLRARNWAAFAYRYNGADYKKHAYDLQLKSHYDTFKSLK